MRYRTQIAGAVLILLAGIGLFFWTRRPAPISDVLARAAELNGKTVRVAGQVRSGGDLLGTGGYELDDGTGTIWVGTRSGSPTIGRRVSVEGRVNKLLQIGTLQVTGLEEVRRD